jgi:hypothetical protein
LPAQERHATVRPVLELATAVRPGAAGEVLVEIENRGGSCLASAAWHPVRLAYTWETADGTVSKQGEADLPARIEPFAPTFGRLSVEAPAREGAYVLRVGLAQNGMLFDGAGMARVRVDENHGAGELQPDYAPIPPSELRVTVVADVPEQARAGHELVTTCQVRNDSGRVLVPAAPHPVHVAYRWFGADGALALEGHRAQFSRPLRPNDEADTMLAIRTPERPGAYELRITLVQEQVVWFDDVDRGNASRHLVAVGT